ncbi:unnamed protein product, partial [Ixodes persulcatus]
VASRFAISRSVRPCLVCWILLRHRLLHHKGRPLRLCQQRHLQDAVSGGVSIQGPRRGSHLLLHGQRGGY